MLVMLWLRVLRYDDLWQLRLAAAEAQSPGWDAFQSWSDTEITAQHTHEGSAMNGPA